MADKKDAHKAAGPSSECADLRSELVETFLALEELDPLLFRSKHLMPGTKSTNNVFGGQVMGQALQAASRTVDDSFNPHVLNGHFLKFGDVRKPILYMVEKVRDGRSYSMRSVKAVQNGCTIFHGQIGFHVKEPDSIKHQSKMPKMPMPEELKDADVVLKELISQDGFTDERRATWQRRLDNLPTTFHVRPVHPKQYAELEDSHPRLASWIKSADKIGSDDRLHHCVAVYVSDASMIMTAIMPHVAAGFRVGMITTLNHSMWLHQPSFRIDDWMLYETDSPQAGGGRALINGRLWARDGTLVMSTAQEGCVRAKVKGADSKGLGSINPFKTFGTQSHTEMSRVVNEWLKKPKK